MIAAGEAARLASGYFYGNFETKKPRRLSFGAMGSRSRSFEASLFTSF
jgi:hypothetical protein